MRRRTQRIRLAYYLVAAAAIAVVTGCGGDDEKGSGSGDKSVVVASWGGEYQEAQAKAFWEPFEKETGIKVIQDESPVNAKTKAQVDSGSPQWDVITIGMPTLLKLGSDYFEPLDYKKYADAYADIPDRHKTKWNVAGAQYCYGIAYRKDMLEPSERPKTWADFWNPEQFPGQRGMALDGGVPWNSVEAAWLAAGNPTSTLGNMDADVVFDQFTKLKPAVGKWWSSGAEALQLLANEEVAMEIAPMGDLYSLAKEGVPIGVSWDDALCGFDYWYILKGAPHQEAAQQLVAYMMDPERQGKFSELSGMGGPNPKSAKHLTGDIVKYLPNGPGNHPAETDEAARSAWWAKNESDIVEQYNKWRLGS